MPVTIKGELINYSNQVINGEVPACIAHKQACQRFINDCNRKDFDYYFDNSEAEKFFKWCSYFKHTKGILAGKQIDLSSIQRFIFGNIYGWLHKETKLRRFNKMYWQVGRKNAKSQSLSLLGSYEGFVVEPMAEIYVGATKKDQAKIVFDEIVAQLAGQPKLKGRYKHAYGKVTTDKTGSVIVPLSKDSGKTGDGLNVQLGIIDEYHAHPTSEIYDVLVSGSGARKQPLMAIITTAGFNLNHPCYTVEYKYVKQILEGVVDNDNYFVMINELDKDDDINNIENLKKANPILASYENGVNYLLNELKVAKDVPEKMRNFLTKNANVWIDDKESVLIPLTKWKECATKYFPILRNRKCYIGIDLSKKIDLTSVSFIFPIGGKYYVKNHSFMPKGTLAEKRHTDKVPYDLWIQQGYITATEGDIIDYSFIQAYIQKTLASEGWIAEEICYDPWSATQFALEMELDGHTIVEVPQNIKRMSEPTKAFRDEVYKGNVLHEDNPVLNWAVSNAVAKIDAQENIQLDKAKSTNRIDPLVATVIGFTRAMSSDLANAKLTRLKNHIKADGFSF